VIVVSLPLDFILLKDLALGVISDVADVDETAEVEDLRSELRHDCCESDSLYQ